MCDMKAAVTGWPGAVVNLVGWVVFWFTRNTHTRVASTLIVILLAENSLNLWFRLGPNRGNT